MAIAHVGSSYETSLTITKPDTGLQRTQSSHNQKWTKKTLLALQDTYQCPMHPEFQSNFPGRCPTCSRYMEKVKPDDGGNQNDYRRNRELHHDYHHSTTSRCRHGCI